MFTNTALMLVLWFASQPLVVDLTKVIPRNRLREPTTVSASGGAVGGDGISESNERQFALRIVSAKANAAPTGKDLIFEVVLTNVAKGKLVVPVHPHLADLEPADPRSPYAFLDLYLAPIVENGSGTCTMHGVSLYGSPNVLGTLTELSQGQSIVIRARTHLTPDCYVTKKNVSNQQEIYVKLSLLLTREYVSQKGTALHEESKQVTSQIVMSNAIQLLMENGMDH